MQQSTKSAFERVKARLGDDKETLEDYEALLKAVTIEIHALEVQRQALVNNRAYGMESALGTVAFRRVLDRAMAADPLQTELDLHEAGLRTLAGDLGYFHAGERQRARAASPG